MHPKNRFWKVISRVFEEEYPKTIEKKKEFLKRNKIALWDVIQQCKIEASSDSSISNVIPNDITSLLQQTKIENIYTTGKKAFNLYQKYVYPDTQIKAIYLPSTSPANATFKEEQLVKEYQIIRGVKEYEYYSKKGK